MRKQLITAGGRERERERGRLVLRRMPMDAAAAASLHSGEDNREEEGERGKDISEQGAASTKWSSRSAKRRKGRTQNQKK